MNTVKQPFLILVGSLLLAIPLLTSCRYEDRLTGADKDGDQSATPEQPVVVAPVQARNDQSPELKVGYELADDGLHISIEGVPEGAKIECTLNETPLTPCSHGSVYPRPAAGDYRIDVDAFRDGQLVAFGRSATFTVLPIDNGTGTINDGEDDPLDLVLKDENGESFRNGMAWNLDDDFKVEFDFFREPKCETKIRCRYDSRSSPFWFDCSKNSRTFQLDKKLLAHGLQYLTAQAQCGERLGPEMVLFWYGVPANYERLMLGFVKDNADRYIFNLLKTDDCPQSQQKFECASADGEFALCEKGNVLDAPLDGDRVRLTCDEETGPELVIGS